ncbi:MAG: phosphoribosylglycinamide formyltransferase [Deltaproteobacteria bacterium]|nr:phosphoribosylglycinamide formyltransferase [Deltaproteobacteria bacterium]
MSGKLRLAVFVSGGGTNLQSIIDSCHQESYPAEIAVVVSNKSKAYGLQRAEQAGIPTEIVAHKDFNSRQEHETEIIRRLEKHSVDLVVLAGYMRVVTDVLLKRFFNHARKLPGVINIHPADTRAYQGAHGYEYAMGQLEQHPERLAQTKITVHFVDSGVDTGPIVRQVPVPIEAGDTLDDLRARGLKVEHQLYPEVIRLYAEGRLMLNDNVVTIIVGAV